MSLEKTAEQIRTMEIRGAGKIAREAAAALRDHAESLPEAGLSAFVSEMNRAAEVLLATRPTAVSLPNAVNITLAGLSAAETESEARALVKSQADRFVAASTKAVERIAEICASRISDGMTIMTHCNSKAALAGILLAKQQGKNISVIATEVRPWNQGLLTIKTLNDHEIPTTYIVDSAVRTFMKEADLVIVGADAVTVKGAVVNKIGTSQIALAA
ncbi:MAG TPA: ribose 1,5-bisphosphate isomerase, partial [Methanocorpusculum sp.]|nr:ribose 1,5-bisphosphate isomerase [Methanocorpusculum sp.]